MLISLQSVSKSFGEQPVVHNVSLQVNKGELLVLLGASGSGKSTLLRLIAGLINPDRGTILFDGVDVTGLPVQKRNIGFVFQHYAIFRHMNVYQNVEFGLKVRGVPRSERRRKADELLELTELTGLGERMPSQLSGGQCQRVALSRALAYNPKVLLLDEPFGALDVRIRRQLRIGLREIQRKLKITTVLVTHDQEEAFELGDRIGVVDRGRLVEEAPAERLYHFPKSEFVATFLGGSNVFVGRARSGKILLGNVELPFPEGAPQHEEGAPVRVLFRPEHVVCQQAEFIGQSKITPLGQGKLQVRNFVGASEKLTFEIPALQGARQLSPQQPYGNYRAMIEASVTSGFIPIGSEQKQFWIGLQRFHVLDPSGFHFLVVPSQRSTLAPAHGVGIALGQATHGFVSLLHVLSPQEKQATVEEEIQRFFARSAHRELRLRQGTVVKEVVREAQERHYDLMIVDRDSAQASHPMRLEVIIRRVLAYARVPILIAQKPWTENSKILVCTAAGEPGKADVRFGARLARHTKSKVTVLHVLRENANEAEVERVNRHLEYAIEALKAVNVEGLSMVLKGDLLSNLVHELKQGSYDLVILGAPGGPNEQRARREIFLRELVLRSQVNVAIVPMGEA